MKEINRDVKRLEDILKSINVVQQYTKDVDFNSFGKNEMMQSACIRHLEIIGEAASKISSELKDEYVIVPWKQIIALRNFIIHEYFKVDIDEVWMTLVSDLPTLKDQVILILNSYK